jgi:pimeloyl-ACP methyl ester carboxylesterase
VITARLFPSLIAFAILAGCIRPQNYHTAGSTYQYRYDSNDKRYGANYFRDSTAYEAYIEFDARGARYAGRQLQAAVDLIQQVRHPDGIGSSRKTAVYVFVHGWKNNASEDSGNVWGFRRFLSDIAYRQCGTAVVGVYIGWPGASLKNDLFLSFWNREPIADTVGKSTEWADTLAQILHAAKDGPNHNYDANDATAVVIGHSFGGIVLEHAATTLLHDQVIAKGDIEHLPADLFVLINEAGAAAIARPFIEELLDQKLVYYSPQRQPMPLLLSMTSVGDVATKIAYPGGEILSVNRTKTEDIKPPDQFGQKNTLIYNIVTAANMLPLQSHEIIPYDQNKPCNLQIPPGNPAYCMNALPPPTPNTTPYWIMQLPQIFVPDHSSVFQDYLLTLIGSIMQHATLANCQPPNTGIAPRKQKVPLPQAPPPPETPPSGRPHLERRS